MFESLQYWHWWVLGLILATLELVVPGSYLIGFGAAAGLTGVIALVAPALGWQIQVLIWCVLSAGAVFALRAWVKNRPIESDQPALNRRGEQYIGRQLTLEEPIVNGLGKIRVDDSTWKVEAEADLPAGAKVRVTAVEGTLLKVEGA